VTYQNDEATYNYIRKLMALPFLPHHEIPAMFARLRIQATTQPLRQIVQYIKDQWIESTIHPIKDWSIYGQPIRTNNDIEGWHYKLNRKAHKGNLQFYLLITLMYSEAKRLPTQMKMISEGKLKIQTQREPYHPEPVVSSVGEVQQQPSQCASSPEEVWCNLRSIIHSNVKYVVLFVKYSTLS